MSDRTMQQIVSDLVTKRGELVSAAKLMSDALDRACFDALVLDRYEVNEDSIEHRIRALRAQDERLEICDRALAAARGRAAQP